MLPRASDDERGSSFTGAPLNGPVPGAASADTGLLDALEARRGIVSVVGAGGKKSCMYCLAALHPGRIGITATVHTPPWPAGIAGRVIVGPPQQVQAQVAAARDVRVVAFAGPTGKARRHGGLEPELITAVCAEAGFDACYVKADGARSRWIKAPGPDEPRVAAHSATVIPVVAARAFGLALDDRICHRPERFAALTGARLGEPVRAEHVARVLAHPEGALKDAGAARIVPLINMVDDERLLAGAREAAHAALALTGRFDRVVLARLRDGALVEVVTR